MTENEIIETHIAENIRRIEVIENFMHSNSDADKETCSKNISVLTKINGLLQEIQQYRAIGTVDQCSKAMDIVKTMIERDMEPVEMEVLQAYIHFENELVDKGFTVKSLLEAAEKMKPKKPIILERKFQNGDEVCTNWKCPICGLNVIEEPPCQEYCQRCGNKLDWSE